MKPSGLATEFAAFGRILDDQSEAVASSWPYTLSPHQAEDLAKRKDHIFVTVAEAGRYRIQVHHRSPVFSLPNLLSPSHVRNCHHPQLSTLHIATGHSFVAVLTSDLGLLSPFKPRTLGAKGCWRQVTRILLPKAREHERSKDLSAW